MHLKCPTALPAVVVTALVVGCQRQVPPEPIRVQFPICTPVEAVEMLDEATLLGTISPGDEFMIEGQVAGNGDHRPWTRALVRWEIARKGKQPLIAGMDSLRMTRDGDTFTYRGNITAPDDAREYELVIKAAPKPLKFVGKCRVNVQETENSDENGDGS